MPLPKGLRKCTNGVCRALRRNGKPVTNKDGAPCCCGGGSGCCFLEPVTLCGQPQAICNLGESFIATFTATASSFHERPELPTGGPRHRETLDVTVTGTIRHYKDPPPGCLSRTQCISLSYHYLFIMTIAGQQAQRTERFASCSNRTRYPANPGRGGGPEATYLLGSSGSTNSPLLFPSGDVLVRSGQSPWENTQCNGTERWWNGTVGGQLIAQSTWNRVEACRSGTLEYHIPPWVLFPGSQIEQTGRSDYTGSITITPERECSGSDAAVGDGAGDFPVLEPGIAEFLRRQQGCVGCGQ